jgi:hypothetical protein
MELTSIIITAIVSPLALKLIEFVLNKSSEQSKSVAAKIEGLSTRVDELKQKNIEQQIEIGVLKAQLLDRDRVMQERDRLIAELKKELDKLRDEK